MPALRSPSLTTSDAVLSTRVRAITGATATTYSLKRRHISKVGVMAAAYNRTYRSGARKERVPTPISLQAQPNRSIGKFIRRSTPSRASSIDRRTRGISMPTKLPRHFFTWPPMKTAST